MSEGLMRRRRRLSSPAPLPDDDDLLREIFLRLPPRPSSLPRASLVCKHWRRLLSDPRFLRRFRAFHRRNPPLLGIFNTAFYGLLQFTPTLDPPDRIPSARLSLQVGHGDEIWDFLGCRHGLALILNRTRKEVVVWNPVSGDYSHVRFPRGDIVFGAAVLRPAGFNHDLGQSSPFELVLLCSRLRASRLTPLVARIYRWESGKWVTTGSAAALAAMPWSSVVGPSVMVGNTLCWLIGGGDILHVDLGTRRLAVIRRPLYLPLKFDYQILSLENSSLGFAVVSGELSLRLWQWNAELDGWLLHRELDLGKLLSPTPSLGKVWTTLLGQGNWWWSCCGRDVKKLHEFTVTFFLLLEYAANENIKVFLESGSPCTSNLWLDKPLLLMKQVVAVYSNIKTSSTIEVVGVQVENRQGCRSL